MKGGVRAPYDLSRSTRPSLPLSRLAVLPGHQLSEPEAVASNAVFFKWPPSWSHCNTPQQPVHTPQHASTIVQYARVHAGTEIMMMMAFPGRAQRLEPHFPPWGTRSPCAFVCLPIWARYHTKLSQSGAGFCTCLNSNCAHAPTGSFNVGPTIVT